MLSRHGVYKHVVNYRHPYRLIIYNAGGENKGDQTSHNRSNQPRQPWKIIFRGRYVLRSKREAWVVHGHRVDDTILFVHNFANLFAPLSSSGFWIYARLRSALQLHKS